MIKPSAVLSLIDPKLYIRSQGVALKFRNIQIIPEELNNFVRADVPEVSSDFERALFSTGSGKLTDFFEEPFAQPYNII